MRPRSTTTQPSGIGGSTMGTTQEAWYRIINVGLQNCRIAELQKGAARFVTFLPAILTFLPAILQSCNPAIAPVIVFLLCCARDTGAVRPPERYPPLRAPSRARASAVRRAHGRSDPPGPRSAWSVALG